MTKTSALVEPRTVRTTLVADQVYEILADDIFSGRLAAGARLPVRDLAEQVGTSVMPVREAIRLLVKNGLAVSTPHRSARVRQFTHRELVQIYELRSLLEIEATRQAAARVDARDLSSMRVALHDLQHAVARGRVHDALDADEALLRRLYTASDNTILVSTIESLWVQCRPYKVMGASAAIAARDNSLWEPQPALIEALIAGDREHAIEITRSSVAAAERRLKTQIPPTNPSDHPRHS